MMNFVYNQSFALTLLQGQDNQPGSTLISTSTVTENMIHGSCGPNWISKASVHHKEAQ